MVAGLSELGVRSNLLLRGGLDLVPETAKMELVVSNLWTNWSHKQGGKNAQLLALGLFGQVSVEKVEEARHLGVKGLADVRVLDAGNHLVELVPHGLGGNTGGGRLEVLWERQLSQ